MTNEGLGLNDVILLIFSGAVAFSTLVYAGLTWLLFRETRKMREAQTEPKISVSFDLNERTGYGMDMVIRNEGQGSAKNIKFKFQGDPTYFDKNRPIDQLPIIKNGLNYQAPNQSFRFFLGMLLGTEYEAAIQYPWLIDVVYESATNQSYRDSYTLDFSQFSELMLEGGPPLYKIEKHLDTLQRDVHHLSTGFNKMRVITQTKTEERKENEKFIDEYRARAAATVDEDAESNQNE